MLKQPTPTTPIRWQARMTQLGSDARTAVETNLDSPQDTIRAITKLLEELYVDVDEQLASYKRELNDYHLANKGQLQKVHDRFHTETTTGQIVRVITDGQKPALELLGRAVIASNPQQFSDGVAKAIRTMPPDFDAEIYNTHVSFAHFAELIGTVTFGESHSSNSFLFNRIDSLARTKLDVVATRFNRAVEVLAQDEIDFTRTDAEAIWPPPGITAPVLSPTLEM